MVTKLGKKKCDDKMFLELNLMEQKIYIRGLVRKVISRKKRLGFGIQWTNDLADELHKPIRRKFHKRVVFAKNVDDIWAVDFVEMRHSSIFNNG